MEALQSSIIDTFDFKQGHLKQMLEWIFTNVRPYIKGRVLEMSTSEFTIGSIILQQGQSAQTLYDEHNSKLVKKPPQNIDLSDQNFATSYTQKLGTYDTVVAIDVISTGFYKKRELENAKELLRSRGRLIAIVPSPVVYLSSLDLYDDYLAKENHKALRKYFGNCDILFTKCFYLSNNTYCFPSVDMGIATLTIARNL